MICLQHLKHLLGRGNSQRVFQSFSRVATLPIALRQMSDKTMGKYSDLSISTTYNLDQQQKILAILNQCHKEELREFSITKNNAGAVVKHRKKYGEFNNLDDVLEVDGFGVSILQKLCDSIVYGVNEDTKPQQAHKMQLCHPILSEEVRQKLKSVVALQLYGQEVVWVQLNRDMVILQWDYLPLTEKWRPCNHVTSLQAAREIVAKLPSADVYLLEHRILRVGTRQPTSIPVIAGIIQLESMIMVLLNQKSGSVFTDRVLTTKHSTVCHLFNLVVGNEYVSGQTLIKDLVDGRPGLDMRSLAVDPIIWKLYNSQSLAMKEKLTKILLHALAFYELELKQRIEPEVAQQTPSSDIL